MNENARTTKASAGDKRLSILVGAPNPAMRERLASALRRQGHDVLEAADAQDMNRHLDETTKRTGKPLDLILCGGLFAEKEDAKLAQRLTSARVTRALVLIPAGGFLSTATRAQRLGATAVLDELPAGKDLWEILQKATGDAEAPAKAKGSTS
jgi:DNA-binding NtrC family response regulator